MMVFVWLHTCIRAIFNWTERDVSTWLAEHLRQLLLAVRVEGPEDVCQLTDVAKLEGEALVNNRRGKLFFFYDWQIKANWLGASDSGVKFSGTLEVPNLSDENDMDHLGLVQAFTRSAATVDGRPEGRFQLLEGNISACFTQLGSLVRRRRRRSRTFLLQDGSP